MNPRAPADLRHVQPIEPPQACHNCGVFIGEDKAKYMADTYCRECMDALGWSVAKYRQRANPEMVKKNCSAWDRYQREKSLARMAPDNGLMQMADGSICEYATGGEKERLERINMVHVGYNHIDVLAQMAAERQGGE